MEQSRNVYRVLVGKPVGKRPLGRPRRRWEDNIKMDLREVGCDPGEWIDNSNILIMSRCRLKSRICYIIIIKS